MAERYINIKTDVIDEYTPTKDTFDKYKNNYIIATGVSVSSNTINISIDTDVYKDYSMIVIPISNLFTTKTTIELIKINNNITLIGSPAMIVDSYDVVLTIIALYNNNNFYPVGRYILNGVDISYLPLVGGTLSGSLAINKTDAVDGSSSALLSLRSNKFPNSTRYIVDDKGLIKLISPATGDSYLYFNPSTNHLYMKKDADSSSGISMDYNTTTPTIKFLGTTGGKVTNLATPTNNTDAANKAYVDSKSGGLRCYYFNDAHFQTTVSKWDPDTNSTLTLDFLEYEQYDVLKEAVLAKDIYDAIVITFSIDNYYTNAIFIRLNPSTNNGFVATQTTIKTAHGNRFVTMKLDENSLEITANSLKLKKQVTATIPVIGWGGSSSGRSYTLSISNITSDSVVYITPQYTVDNYKAVSAAWSSISFAETGANKITFYIVGGQQPTTAIPLQIAWED